MHGCSLSFWCSVSRGSRGREHRRETTLPSLEHLGHLGRALCTAQMPGGPGGRTQGTTPCQALPALGDRSFAQTCLHHHSAPPVPSCRAAKLHCSPTTAPFGLALTLTASPGSTTAIVDDHAVRFTDAACPEIGALPRTGAGSSATAEFGTKRRRLTRSHAPTVTKPQVREICPAKTYQGTHARNAEQNLCIDSLLVVNCFFRGLVENSSCPGHVAAQTRDRRHEGRRLFF